LTVAERLSTLVAAIEFQNPILLASGTAPSWRAYSTSSGSVA